MKNADKILLSKEEKELYLLIKETEHCPKNYPEHIFSACASKLQRKGLIYVSWKTGHEFVSGRLTDYGKEYIALNPTLSNPVDWNFIANFIVSAIAAVASVIALFKACSFSVNSLL